MLSKEEVIHIAKLARLGLTDAEIKKYQKDLSAILDYIEKLKEVDIEGVEPTSHSVLVENIMRKDASKNESVDTECQQTRERIIEQMPETKDGYLKVKSVF